MGDVETIAEPIENSVVGCVGKFGERIVETWRQSKAVALLGSVLPPGPMFSWSVLVLWCVFAVCLRAGIGGATVRSPVEPRAGAVALSSAPAQTVELTLPFAGIWGVVQGFDSGDTHVGYAAYAIDFVPAERLDRAIPEARRRRLTDFPCFGRPVLAPADGTVVWARDGAPDLPPFNTAKHDAGNFVILEHAEAEYTELRHLQSGSVRVKVGDRVARGQEIARCGNSGNAKTPHLHVGFLGSVNPIATRPMRFSRYQVLKPGGRWQAGEGVPRVQEILRAAPVVRGSPGPHANATDGGN